MGLTPREIFTRIVRALEARDLDALDDLIHPEFVGDFPQSGERLHGIDAWKSQAANYPGGETQTDNPVDATIIGDEDRWAISPNYTVVPLAGMTKYTIIQRTQYPDGSRWYVLVIAELRDEKVYRADSYFAPEMPAPLLGALLSGSAGTQ